MKKNIKFSVNINKIATLRNSRGGNIPDVVQCAKDIQQMGADGITVHPRPDERHIRYEDVRMLKKIITTEFNIEGNPQEPKFVELVLEVKPTQVTLVPDTLSQLTSNHGWDISTHKKFLTEVIDVFKKAGIRTSIFVDPIESIIADAVQTGTQRIELYTEFYAHTFSKNREKAITPYKKTVHMASALGLEINAGHDLNLHNLNYFARHIEGLLEVSIGQAFVADALYLGLKKPLLPIKRNCKYSKIIFMNNPKIIAIDGYSACGKSTLAKQLAQQLNYTYIDTGAMYRAITLYMFNHHIDVSNKIEIKNCLPHIQIEFKNIDNEQHIFLNNKDVNDAIRSMDISEKVSVISAISAVRTFAVSLQREMGQSQNVVMDGRDIGTVVFPHAEVKFFMTADKAIRVQRRYEELRVKNPSITKEAIAKNIEERDYLDENRKDSPLKQAADACLIDNSHLSIEQQLNVALEYINNPQEKENLVGMNRFFMIVLYFVMAGGLAFFLSMTMNSIITNVLKNNTIDSVGVSLLVCIFHCIVGFILFGMSILKPKIPMLKLFKIFFLLPIVLIVLYYIIKSTINQTESLMSIFTTINMYYVLFMYLITGGVAYYFIYKILGSSKTI